MVVLVADDDEVTPLLLVPFFARMTVRRRHVSVELVLEIEQSLFCRPRCQYKSRHFLRPAAPRIGLAG